MNRRAGIHQWAPRPASSRFNASARLQTQAVAQEALKNYEYEEWAELEVRKGRPLKGLFPVAGDQAKADYEAWKKAGGKK